MEKKNYEGGSDKEKLPPELEVIIHNYTELLRDYERKLGRFKDIGLKLKHTFYEEKEPENKQSNYSEDHIGLLQRNNDYFMRDNLEFNELLDVLEQII